MSVINVGKPLVWGVILLCTKEYILEKNHINAMSVGMLSVNSYTSGVMRKLIMNKISNDIHMEQHWTLNLQDIQANANWREKLGVKRIWESPKKNSGRTETLEQQKDKNWLDLDYLYEYRPWKWSLIIFYFLKK